MNCDSQEYFVIFDTNTLYHSYDKRANFLAFSFNSTFENVIGFINQLDIYEHVVAVVPTVVWNEMEQQILEAHKTKIQEFRDKSEKLCFPEIIVEDKGDMDYLTFIHPIIEKYRTDLSSDINKVIEIPVASEARYNSIVTRAFEKRPPFEGKEKKSDKGFKDALLWESILEFATQHDTANFIYYSKDNAFGKVLEDEFCAIFPNAEISICPTENDVKKQLESWAKDIDIYSYTPIETYVEHKDVIDWLQSGDFSIQMIDRDYGLVEKSRLITDSTVHLVSYDNIQITNETDEETDYSIEAVLGISYTFKDNTKIDERINVTILVSHLFDGIFVVEDAYFTDETDFENDVTE